MTSSSSCCHDDRQKLLGCDRRVPAPPARHQSQHIGTDRGPGGTWGDRDRDRDHKHTVITNLTQQSWLHNQRVTHNALQVTTTTRRGATRRLRQIWLPSSKTERLFARRCCLHRQADSASGGVNVPLWDSLPGLLLPGVSAALVGTVQLRPNVHPDSHKCGGSSSLASLEVPGRSDSLRHGVLSCLQPLMRGGPAARPGPLETLRSSTLRRGGCRASRVVTSCRLTVVRHRGWATLLLCVYVMIMFYCYGDDVMQVDVLTC